MGLDVHLHQYRLPVSEVNRLDSEEETKRDALYDEVLKTRGYATFDELPKSEHGSYFDETKRLRKERGIRDWDETDGWRAKVEIDSAVYPKHMFKIGYLRSSYNDGGIDRVMGDAIGKRLDTIFPGDTYQRVVDWGASLVLARQVRDEFAKWVAATGPVRVRAITANIFGYADQIKSAAAAMARFQKERARWASEERRPGFGDYMTGDGYYMQDGIEIIAAIRGTENILGSQPAVYLIERVKDSISEVTGKLEGPYAWYQQALEITVEMCEWVLGQPDPSTYLLHWSG